MSRSFKRATTLSLMGLCLGALGPGTAFASDTSTSGMQTSVQSNDTDQWARSEALALQLFPRNEAANISWGGDGRQSINQSNTNSASSSASNSNSSTQNSSQRQHVRGMKHHGSGWARGHESSWQGNDTDQAARSSATAVQVAPRNEAANISRGGDGSQSVNQSNTNSASSKASNSNSSSQNNTQNQQVSGAKRSGSTGATQSSWQGNDTDQAARSSATAVQLAPVNAGANVSVLGSGNQNINQSNTNTASSSASNSNSSSQNNTQNQQVSGATK